MRRCQARKSTRPAFDSRLMHNILVFIVITWWPGLLFASQALAGIEFRALSSLEGVLRPQFRVNIISYRSANGFGFGGVSFVREMEAGK